MKISGLAFLGGLLLNLMPCVFPVLFLKGLALVNSGSEERHKLRAHGFVYAAGILVSFWALVAALLILRGTGARLGWGFQFQSPVFLELMAGLLFFLGLSLAGQFDVGLTLTGAGGSLAAKQGYTGSFFTGVLAVVVATPCTAPLMGTAIGYALAQPAGSNFRGLHGACARPRRSVCGAHAATGLDTPTAAARSVDGCAEAGHFRAHFRYGDLAGLGGGSDLRLEPARCVAGQLSAAGDCGLVPGSLAGQALGIRLLLRSLCLAWLYLASGPRANWPIASETSTVCQRLKAPGSHGPPTPLRATRRRVGPCLWTLRQSGA